MGSEMCIRDRNYTVQVPVTEMREERFAVRVPCKPGEKPDSDRKIVYRDEIRTREVPVQKMRTEFKSRRPLATQNAPVQVPYTDIETQKYSVRVPYYADEAPDVAKGENVSPSKPIVALFNGQSGRGVVGGSLVGGYAGGVVDGGNSYSAAGSVYFDSGLGGKSWLAKNRTLDTGTGASSKIRYRLENRTRQVPYTTMTTQTKTRMVPCLLYTSPSPRDATLSRMPSSA